MSLRDHVKPEEAWSIQVEEINPDPKPGEAWLRVFVYSRDDPKLVLSYMLIDWGQANLLHADLTKLIEKRAGT